jgi:hypothetical protein
VQRWSCPHHHCAVCHRKTQAAGGLLFRCEVRPASALAVHQLQQLQGCFGYLQQRCSWQSCSRHAPTPRPKPQACCSAEAQRGSWINVYLQVCANAFCEDHLPGEAHLEVHCRRFQALGQVHPKHVRGMPPCC